MKKTLKRSLSLLLTLILMFTFAGSAFAATRDNVKHYKEYTCLGDSIATGLNYDHLDASTTFEETPGSYHSIIRQAAGAKLHQYAFSGNSTKETRYIFEPDYELDEYCFWDIVGVTAEQIDGMRPDIIEAVRNSDLITINLGSNDVFTYAMRAAFTEEETAEETYAAPEEETWVEQEEAAAYEDYEAEIEGTIVLAEESGTIALASAEAEEAAPEIAIAADEPEETVITDGETAETADASTAASLIKFMAKLSEGGRMLRENYRAIINDILELNPDTTIVIVGMYNPFRNVKLSADSVFTGDYMGRMVVDPVNIYLRTLAASYSNVYYASVPDTETYYDIKDITMSDEEFLTYMIIDTHPTPDGHQYMADQILSVLPERDEPTSYELDKTDLTLITGETETLTVTADNGFTATAEWSSSREDVASVDENGVVTANKAGKAVITATVGDFSVGCDVQVLFTDVTDPGLFYYDYIYDMVDKDVVGGFDDGSFRPLGDCNRAAVATFLWRMAGRPEPKTMATFKDMTGNSDFDTAISWAQEQGITTGWEEDNTFRPWNKCNRAAIVTFLWRFAGRPKPESVATFKDMTGKSDFDKAISWAAENELTTGWDDNTFRPWNTCNRLAIVSFLARYDALETK